LVNIEANLTSFREIIVTCWGILDCHVADHQLSYLVSSKWAHRPCCQKPIDLKCSLKNVVLWIVFAQECIVRKTVFWGNKGKECSQVLPQEINHLYTLDFMPKDENHSLCPFIKAYPRRHRMPCRLKNHAVLVCWRRGQGVVQVNSLNNDLS